MKTKFHRRIARTANVASAALLVWATAAGAQEGSQKVELVEAGVAVKALQQKVEALQASLLKSEEKGKVLGEGLAAANAESAQFRESYQKIRLQLEALGVSALDGSGSGLEQRLLQAVNDRRLLQDENARLSEEVFHLSEVLLAHMNGSVGADAEVQKMADGALRRAEDALRISVQPLEGSGLPESESGSGIHGAQVISLKADYGLVVFNVGSDQGVRVGMPFRVVRKDRLIGTVLVVDVREKICGAVVQSLASEEPFAVGDVARVAAE